MLDKRNPQLNKNGELIHLLSPEGLSRDILTHILDTASNFVSVNDREIKKLPLLRGKSVFNLFFENSTRTRTTFDIAAKRLSADVFTLDIGRSSTAKGETLLDTIDNLSAMAADIFVVRHSESGAPYLIAKHVAPHVHVVNAGDGRHAHPTQGLLDAYTIRHYKKDFTQLRVAIVGDVLHSRVARSDIHALLALGFTFVMYAGMFFGFQFFGLLADRVGRRRAMLAAFAACAVSIAVYIVVRSPMFLFWWGAVVGFALCGAGGILGAYYAELFPGHLRAYAGGFCWNMGRIGAMAAPYTIGVIGKTHGLQAGLAITSGIYLMGAAMLFMLPETYQPQEAKEAP